MRCEVRKRLLIALPPVPRSAHRVLGRGRHRYRHSPAMESATAAVRSASLARARPAPLVHGRARGAGRVVGAGLAARARRRALVAVASHQEHHEPLPPRAQEGGAVAVATQVSRGDPESCARLLLGVL